MKAVSLFTGVGGMDLAFERAGVETVLQAERDEHCRRVLERHWGEVRRVSDVRDVGAERVGDATRAGIHVEGGRWGLVTEPVDIVHGGFPCQPFSVAGRRRGAEDERDGWPEFRRVVRELRPRWVVAENVPGLLSIDSGRYFGQVIGDLDDLGFAVAWAVLDARHFGVAQRRRRVFIVAGPGRRAVEQVLAICESCGGHPETGGEAGEGAAGAIAVRTAQTGSNGWGVETDGTAYTLDGTTGQAVLAPTLAASGRGTARVGESRGQDPLVLMGGGMDLDHDTYVPEQVTQAMSAKWAKGSSGPAGDGVVNLVVTGGVRRLTPLECERLQGFPDRWTEFYEDGTRQADSHRYRQMGNAVAVPCVEWIARRLVAVDALQREGALQ